MMNKIIDKIHSFSHLENGWCIGYETPPNEKTILFSIKIVNILFRLKLDDIDAFPGDTNSIFIVPMRNDISLDIEIQNNNILTIEAQKGIGTDYKILNFWENVNFSLFYMIIYNLSLIPNLKTPKYILPTKPFFLEEKCISEFLTQRDMINEGKGTIHRVLNRTEKESQFLNLHVPFLKTYQYVNTSQFISPQYAKVVSL